MKDLGLLISKMLKWLCKALSSLQLQDIQVGLISHVQSLIENIDHKVRVDELLNIAGHKSHKELPTTSRSFANGYVNTVLLPVSKGKEDMA